MSFFAWFMVISLIEMGTFIWVQSVIGLGWALGIALATAVIGSFLVRRAGLSAMRRIRDKMNGGSLPGRELVDGAAILVAGAFLISPGLITDTLGFILLIPAVRGLIYRIISKRFATRMSVFTSSTTERSGNASTRDDTPPLIIDIEEVE